MLVRVALASLALILSSSAFAQTHSMIDSTRSSLRKNIFLTAAAEGEYGNFEKTMKDTKVVTSEAWRGYGIRNGVGVELMKFTQFSLSHTLLNMRSSNDSLESLNGSRLSAELAFTFSSPVSNILLGIGMTADQLNYQGQQKTATYTGTGRFYSLGLNYFLSPSISLQGVVRRQEAMNNFSGGTSAIEKLKSKTDSLTLGLAVWL